jgi:electron transport complex protein RnfD
MGDTLLPLLFLLAAAIYYTGVRALTLTLISVISCIVFEYLYRRFLGKNRTVGDLSAVVTGLIIAFCMPVTAPVWFPIVGAFFAIIVVKQLFGGIGRNIFNPAAAAICLLTVTWPGIMSQFPMPTEKFSAFATPKDFTQGISVLTSLKKSTMPNNSIFEMLIGYVPGNFGTSAIIILLAAGLVLLFRRIINWRIPVSLLLTVAVFAFIFPRCPSGRIDSVFYELFSGSLMFVAIFMATDPVTSPVTNFGRVFYGITCGLVTVFMRYFGIYPEAAFFALLLVNPFVLAFDRLGWRISTKGGRLLYEQEQ